MAIRRTKKQKEHAAYLRQSTTSYQFEDKLASKVEEPHLDQKQLKKLLSSDPKLVQADLVRTMITTVIILLLLLVIYFWLK